MRIPQCISKGHWPYPMRTYLAVCLKQPHRDSKDLRGPVDLIRSGCAFKVLINSWSYVSYPAAMDTAKLNASKSLHIESIESRFTRYMVQLGHGEDRGSNQSTKS